MSSTITDIATGLKANLDSIEGVNVSKYPRSNPVGSLIHMWPNEIPQYHKTMQTGLSEVVWTIELLWPYNDDAGTAAQVYDFLEPFGVRSVREQVESDKTLGGVASDVWCDSCTGLTAGVTQDNQPRLSAQWTVVVLVAG